MLPAVLPACPVSLKERRMANGEIMPINVTGMVNRTSTPMNAPAMMPICRLSTALAAALSTGPAAYGTTPSVKAAQAKIPYIVLECGDRSAQRPPRK